jgi:thioredoxin-related protein
MKPLLTSFLFLLLSVCFAQQPVKLYNPDADASAEIAKAIIRAGAENKHIFLQIGGNWCPWCLKYQKFCAEDKSIDSIMSKGYIAIKVNYSKENRNYAILKKLHYPQRFGFPVFIILDKNGNRIHTQNSAYLEEGESYSRKKVLEFLNNWTPDALNPDHYKEN